MSKLYRVLTCTKPKGIAGAKRALDNRHRNAELVESDSKPPPVSTLTTKLMRCLILLVVFPFAIQAQFGLARTISIEVAAEGYEGDGIWVGLFTHPITTDSSPNLWQHSKSTETTLQISDQEDVVLVALQKGSVPLYQRIEPSSREKNIELQFQKGRSLKGEVLSADGFQIEGATISINHLEGLQPHQYPDEFIADWLSSQLGTFSISGLKTGTYQIQITPRVGIPEELLELVIIEEEPEIKVENLQLQNVYFISGEVLNEENETVDEAEIIATEWNEGLASIQTLTDETGSFIVGPFVKDKSIWVEAQVLNRSFSNVQAVVAGQTDVKLTLRKLLNLKGAVVEKATGNLVEKFTVSALSGVSSNRIGRWTNEYTFDGSLGHFSIDVDWRITHLVVEAPGFDFCFLPVIVSTENVHDIGTIELARGRTVGGKVADAATGDPVVGAEIRRIDWNQSDDDLAVYTYERRESSITDELGKFTLSPLPIEEVTVEVRAAGYFRSETNLSKGQESIEIEIRKKSHPTILGRVESLEGQPLEATVSIRRVNSPNWMGSDTRPTNLDGTFELIEDDGTYELYATKSGFASSNTETVVVENQVPVDDVLLLIKTSGNSISGRVTGLVETESVTVRLKDAEANTLRRAFLRGNHSYSFEGIPEGDYTIEGTSSLKRELSKQVMIEGSNSSVSVDLAFDGTSNLSGMVTAGGHPVDNVRVWAEPKTEGHIRGESRSEEDGSYSIENLDDGEYDIHTDRGLSFEVVITSETYFDIEVGKLTFAGNVVTQLPTQDMIVILQSDSDESIYATSSVDSEGTFRIDGLTAGSYSIRVTKPGRIKPTSGKTTYSLSLDHSLEDYQIELGSD
ncbi:MAG: carboxypeptidase regulatory-like domain-containing protein [Gammaproteobacteria bacterium]|nr:carboxypeptidase regulatory-like domain-containing protein [Gammaproteobacteria bacterium]